MALVLLYLRDGHPADTACWRRCHASIKSRQTSPTGDERQNKRKSGPAPADSLKESQLAARSGPSPPRRTSPTTRIQTASLNAIARFRPGRRHAALRLLVRLSSERVRQAVPQDCSFAEKQASPPALLVVVRSESDTGDRAGWRSGRKSKRPVLLLARSGTLSRRMESYAFLASYV